MSSRLTTICVSVCALLLGACSVNIKNLHPLGVSVNKSDAQSIATAAGRTGRSDVVETARLLGALVERKAQEQRLLTDVYQERAGGSDYSEEMRRRLETLITLNRSIGEFSARLALSTYGGASGQAVLRTAEVSDELYQLLLGYTIAGLEWNAGYLTAAREQYANELIIEQRKLMEAESQQLAALTQRLRAEVRTPKQGCCQLASVGGAAERKVVPSIVLTGEAMTGDDKKLLRDAIQHFAASSHLAKAPGITLRVDVSHVQKSSSIGNTITLLLFFYPGSGGDVRFSAALEKAGEQLAALDINTYAINAKDFGTMVSLVANRVVGAAHFALLRAEVAA